MGRLLFWMLVLGIIAGGYYIYTQDPDPAEARAAVNGAFASLHTRLNEAIANASQDMNNEVVDETTDEDPTPEETPAPALSNTNSGDNDLSQYRAWISEARARHPYPESEERMYAVMMCESGGRATIVNQAGPYSGLFQYSTATWNGDWNTYRDEGILDPRAQIFATALAWSNGMQGHWGCYSRPH